MKLRSEAEQEAGIKHWLGWLFGIGGCIVVLDQALYSLNELSLWHAWWNAGTFIVVAGIVTLAVGGLLLPLPVLRMLWLGVPILYAALQCLWVPGARDPGRMETVPWIWALEPPVVTMLLLSLRPIAVICASLLISLLPAVSSLVLLGTVPHSVVRETPIQLANVVYVAIFIGVYAQLRRLRAQESKARDQQRREARAAALAVEHARVSRVVHDEMLSAMAAAIQTEGSPPMLMKRAASGALAALDSAIGGAQAPRTRSETVQQAFEAMVADLRAVDHRFMLDAALAPGSIRSDAARAATLAAAEALRNSMRHAGEHATRRVRIDLSDDRLRITVSDDGVGFDPEARRDGLGIPESIERRMLEAGGSTSIRSRPDRGTEVTISWPI